MQEQEMTYDQFRAKYPAAAPRRNVKDCRYFEGGALAQPRDDRDAHEVRIVEHTAMDGGLTLEWATLDRDLLNGHRLQVSSYRVTDAPRPAAGNPLDVASLDERIRDYEERVAAEIAQENWDEGAAEIRAEEIERENELWDAGAAARHEDQLAQMARDDRSREIRDANEAGCPGWC